MTVVRPKKRSDINPFMQGVVGVFLAMIVAWLFLHAFDAVPHADDFCYGTQVNAHGILGNVISEYFRWGGRFASTFLVGVFVSSPLLISAHLYLAPLLVLILLGLSAGYFASHLGVKNKLFSLLFFTLLVGSLNWWETILWLTAGFTYGIASAILLFLLSQEIYWYCSNTLPKKTWLVCLGLLSLLLAGFNETIMVAHVSFLGLCTFGSLLQFDRRKLSSTFGILFICAFAGALVVALAPGNAVRASAFASPNLLIALFKSIFWLIESYFTVFLLAVMQFIAAMYLFRIQPKYSFSSRSLWDIAFFLLIGLIMAIFTRQYAQGSLGPLRAQSVDYFMTIIGAFICSLILYKPNINFPWKDSSWKNSVLASFIVMALLLIQHNPDGKFWRTLVQMRLDTGFHNFFQPYLLKALNNPGKDLVIQNYEHTEAHLKLGKPRTMFLGDFTSDSEDWTNKCFAAYYDLKSVKIAE
jgi:hypothetical protein